MLRRSPIIADISDGFEVNLAFSTSFSTPPGSPALPESPFSEEVGGSFEPSDGGVSVEDADHDEADELREEVKKSETSICAKEATADIAGLPSGHEGTSSSPRSLTPPNISNNLNIANESSQEETTPDTPISRYRKEYSVFLEPPTGENPSPVLPISGTSYPAVLPLGLANRQQSNCWSMPPLSLDSRLAIEISVARQLIVQQGAGIPTMPLTTVSAGTIGIGGPDNENASVSTDDNDTSTHRSSRLALLEESPNQHEVEHRRKSDDRDDDVERSQPNSLISTESTLPTTSWIHKAASNPPPPSPLSPYGKANRLRGGRRRLQQDRSKSLVDDEDQEDDVDQGDMAPSTTEDDGDNDECSGSAGALHIRNHSLPSDWEEKKESLELPTLLEETHDTVETLPRSRTPLNHDYASAALSPNEARRSLSPTAVTSSITIDQMKRKPKFSLVRAVTTGQIPLELEKTLSLTESDVGSLDGLPPRLRSRWGNDFGAEKTLQRIDGIPLTMAPQTRRSATPNETTIAPTLRPNKFEAGKSTEQHPQIKQSDSYSFFSNWPLRLLWGDQEDGEVKDHDTQPPMLGVPGCCRQDDETSRFKSRWKDEDDSLALLACANLIHHRPAPPVQTSLIRVTSEPPPLSYSQAYAASHRLHDPRMPAWVEHQFRARDKSSKDGQYLLGKSRAVIVHEIVRGNWTWATAWSPDGTQLAVGTENHHLAILDTASSTVWRVRHDRKLQGPVKMGTTHSIRSIAWGSQYIAIGGTGNAVSILAPVEPYAILHTIQNCGFVGSLAWRPDSCDLVIGSRLDRAMLVRIQGAKPPISGELTGESQQKGLTCDTLQLIERKHWVHAVAFSPSGRFLAIGDAGGHMLVYSYGKASDAIAENHSEEESLSLIKTFTLEDAVLAVEWSPEGSWLYAGGEDFSVTVIETKYWEVVHKIKRDRWVQCIAASHSGTHVAVGGVSSEVSLLETKSGWDSVMGIELNGLVPLSANWHPRDQFLALTGQNNSVVVVETTNARHVNGHHLHAVGGILAVEFSPDGRMAAVGNDTGVVTFFSLSGSTFVTAYELVVKVSSDKLSIKWSPNGLYVVIATRDSLLVVGRKKKDRYGKAVPPKCSGFSIRKVVGDLQGCHSVSVDFQSHYVAVAGSKGTCVLDATRDFSVVREWTSGPCYATAWSPLGRWLATIGKDKVLTIYDTSEERVDRWRAVFSVTCDYVGRALAWGPLIVGGLLYLAYAGDGNEITIMEIRTQEGTWETVMRIQRAGGIHSLDWHTDGLLAAAISNGTVSIVDLAYLQSGVAVNEMDYNWQRQALTSFTEIRRNRATNKMRAVRWIPSAPGSDSLLAVGGTDGELEIIDLTERQRCKGYSQKR